MNALETIKQNLGVCECMDDNKVSKWFPCDVNTFLRFIFLILMTFQNKKKVTLDNFVWEASSHLGNRAAIENRIFMSYSICGQGRKC